MTKRASIKTDQIGLDEAWEYYHHTRDSIIQAAEHTKRNIFRSTTAFDPRFFAMSAEELEEELEEYLRKMLDETDQQACLFLIASAEAALRVDFLQRVYQRKRDSVSQEFRIIYKTKCHHTKTKVALDKDILSVWADKLPQSRSYVGDLRGAMKYRHWLAHGRWWVPKLGRRYDPAGIFRIITGFFTEIGLSNG